MKKLFGFRSKKGVSPFGSSISLGRDRGHHKTSFQPWYHIRDKDLRKIHKAASVGNVAKVQQVLLLGENGLNEKDKRNRTALHLACANGHPAVVAFLLERKCLLNLCDSENRTALMKAVECQEEECATLLLEHGADPNLTDANGNTALHHAVFCQNISLAAKLLSYDANIEARNEDDLTPLLLAISERKQQMVKFLVKKEANVHAVDKMKRTALILAVSYESMSVVSLLLQRGADVFSQDVFGRTAEEYAALSGFNIICQLISEYKEKRPKTPPEKSNPVDTSSEEDSLSRFSNKPGADSWPPSDDEVLDFETKHVPKPNLAKLLKAFQQSKRNDWDSTSLSLSSETCQRAGHLKADDRRPLVSQSVTQNQSAPTELGQKTATDKEKMKNAAMFLVGNSMPHHPGQSPLPENRESKQDLSGELDVEVILEEEQGKLHGNENNDSQVEEEKKHKSSEVEVSDNVCDAAEESRLSQQRKSGGNNKQEFPAMQNKGSDGVRTSFSISYEARLVVMNSLSSEPGMPRKEIERKNNDKWTPEECVIAPVFEKTNSLTDGLLHVNDDSILRKVDQDDSRPARKTAYEKKKVSDSGRKAKDLLRKYHMLQDEIASLRLEIDAVKNQNWENEKKYSEDIENLQQAMKSIEEIFTQTIFQYTGQLTVLGAENTMLNSELENNRQSRHRRETKVESYRSRLAAAIHDHEQGQTSQRDLELAFQKAHDERLCLQDQMKCHVTKLKSNRETASQQLPKVESKFNKLKMKPHQTRDDLRGKTLKLECVQRDLRQAECQKQEIEHMDQNEQGKVNENLGKQESLEERLSQLQSENMLLRQHLDDAQNKADSKEKTVISIQDHFQQMVRKLHAESEKQRLMLEERNKELINKCNHLEERMCQYENEEAEGKLQEAQDQHTEAMRCAEKTQDHIQRLEIENAKLQTTIKKQVGKVEQLQKTLSNTRLTDHLPAELGAACSQCLHLDATYQVLQRELLSMKGWQRKCEKLEKENKKLEQEVVKLKSPMELKMIEHPQVEQYKREIEERVRQDFLEKWKEVNLFLQVNLLICHVLEFTSV
ncbi:putative ankyrin repeat domain-containing protein 20A3 isoform X1 [Cervus elaphus]|uniref:putative ankyrin repeat domain-containing protein 20A3 isoform X1 n=1 Tax=Cervus elaphus TaxID=9860 RepID=UPI001CC2807F|nr:putative ankyrin repeat domain-containing protein 20A3 isoform X1 [Cervus elaphus]